MGRRLVWNQCDKWIRVLMGLLMVAHVAMACPKTCQCKWRNGKQWVTCTYAKFIDIPRGLEPSTQVLNLQNNNLKILFRDAFYEQGLVNLQKVFLSHCKLIKLEKGSLSKINNLIELDLSSNFLTSVPWEALIDVPGLRELELRENNLTYLGVDAFGKTPDLVLLDISFNNISAIHNQAFRSLTRLEVLKISGNKVSTVNVDILKPLVALHGFHVHFNPWNCDCILRPLRHWMMHRNIVTSIPPKCHQPPRLKGHTWKSLDLDEFVCVPQVTAIAYRILASSGENVSLACAVGNDPEAQVTWKLGDKLLTWGTNVNEHRYKVMELVLPVKEQDDHIRRMSNLTISGAALQDQGIYKCVVENKAGRVETNMTLKVSQVISEEPLVAVNEMFVAGAVLGALLFVLISVIIVSIVLYKRGRQLDDDLLKLNNDNCKVSLPLQHLCNDDDLEESKGNKKFEYESVPTCEVTDENETSDSQRRLRAAQNEQINIEESPSNENVLNDLDKSDPESNIQKIANNILHDENISYVEIPKSQLNNINQDQNPLLKNLAQQCRDEIMRRKYLKRSKRPNVSQQYPDLLDFPKEHSPHHFSTLPRRSSTSTDVSLENLNQFHHKRNPSLPSTPVHPDLPDESDPLSSSLHTSSEDPAGRRQSLTLPLGEAFDLQFHAAQLENFLQEYKNLQEQLFRMKESEAGLYVEKDFNVLPNTDPLLGATQLPLVSDHIASSYSVPSPECLIRTTDEYLLSSPTRSPEPLKSILKSSSTSRGDPLSSSTSSAISSTSPSATLLQKGPRGRGVFFHS